MRPRAKTWVSGSIVMCVQTAAVGVNAIPASGLQHCRSFCFCPVVSAIVAKGEVVMQEQGVITAWKKADMCG
jgi:hypothetical protein